MKGNHVTQPEAVAKLKGVYRPSKYPDSVQDSGITFLTIVPEPPKRLNAIGIEFWSNILGGAIHIDGYIAVHDIYMFEELCYIYQLMTAAKKDIELFGNTEITQSGQRIKSVGYQIYKDTLKDFQTLCREFGLSPSSRNAIKFKQQGEKKESLEDFKI